MSLAQDELLLLGIALAWLAYGAIHSWLAGSSMKQRVQARWPTAYPAYRLGFNLLAVALLVPPLWLTLSHSGDALWFWPRWITWPVAVLVGLGFLWSLKWYDGAGFLGLRQWLGHDGEERESLRISPLHRHVRHPWYTLGLLLLWTRDLNVAWLLGAAVITVYVVIGSRLEERKLLERYGSAYARYRTQVPALLPWPGKRLSRIEARNLEALARLSAEGKSS